MEIQKPRPSTNAPNKNEVNLPWPEHFELFNLAKIQSIHLERLSLKSMKKKFLNDLFCVFGTQGEVNGYVYAFIETNQEYDSDLLKEYHQSLFIEASNIIIGRMLTELDNRSGLLSHLHSPLVFPKSQNKALEFKRRSRYEDLFFSLQDDYQKEEKTYSIEYQNNTFKMNLTYLYKQQEILNNC
jgi:hypothetical protein